MRAFFVVNPAAGAGRGASRWKALEERALAAHPGSKAASTEERGHAARLARRALEEGFEAVVAVGGDGTLGEAAEGFLTAPAALRARAALGTWPAGSGCDFARYWGIGRGPGGPAEYLSRARPRLLDVGRAEFTGPDGRPASRHFLSLAGVGLAADIAARAEAGAKSLGGTLGYLWGALGGLLGARPVALDLVVDGAARPRGLFHVAALSNTSTAGGGMRLAPDADPQDGRLDLLTVGPFSRPALLRRLPRIYLGTHAREPGVELSLARRLEASAPEGEAALNLDGEMVGRLPARFEVLPGALPFLV